MIPAVICCLSHFQRLHVADYDQHVRLASLPRGPYLRNLQQLDINGPDSGAGPEALTDAVRLRMLSVLVRQDTHPLWTISALLQLVPKGCVVELWPDGETCPIARETKA